MTMILTTLLAAAGLCASPTPVQTRPVTSVDTAEGAEILRRILVAALDDAFAHKEDGEESTTSFRELDRLGVVTNLWAHRETVQHARVFHLPEVGLFFALDAALPVVSKEPKKDKQAKGDKAKDDEWERARRELRGDFGGEIGMQVLRSRSAKATEIDPRAIDQVLDLVLKTAARHAARIEGLAPQETITVALRLSGRGHTLWSGAEPEGEGDAHAWTSEAGDEPAQSAFSFVLAAGGSSAREQSLVIRIALADLAGFAEGGIERLRQRAEINRY